jgi:hypothetical protein
MEFLVFLRLSFFNEPDDIFHYQAEVFVVFGIHPRGISVLLE